ncbi:MAG: hypothetical protein JXR39_05945 [Marinilabiliaceae bacterium]|nr:hypothetical protein [Marinilabiliaceae bacterium]
MSDNLKKNNEFQYYSFFIIGIISLVIAITSAYTGMFWDNVTQIFKLSNWLYTNGLSNLIFPNEFDPGIPPTIPLLFATTWKIFGQSLIVSHILMWPFIWGLLWQLLRLCDYFINNKKYNIWIYCLIIADPSFSSMLVLVNYEVIQYFLFFGAINSILNTESKSKTIFLFFLSIISLRSMMLCASVFLFDISINYNSLKQTIKKTYNFLIPYLIGALPAIIFLFCHYRIKGWVFGNADSPWAECGTMVDINSFLWNIIVLIHRMADFGRIFLWGTIFFLLITLDRNKIYQGNTKIQLKLLITSIVIIGGTSLMINNPMGHRYFIASYIIFALITGNFIINNIKRKKLTLSILIIGLISGNLWVYPPKISQGWDSTLAHLPYWNLRREIIKEMDEKGIPIENTASFFPNKTTVHSIDLNGDNRSFIHFSGNEEYVFYSNVYNLSDEELDKIRMDYQILFSRKYLTVQISLLKRKKEQPINIGKFNSKNRR